MSKDFFTAVKERRSIYRIGKDTAVPDSRIEEIVSEAVKYTPSSFNSQSARVVVLFGDHHNKLWDITKETLRKIVPSENFAPTEQKIDSFRAGYASVLFFEDTAVVEQFQKQFPTYTDLVQPIVGHAAICRMDGSRNGRTRCIFTALQSAD